MSVRLESGDAPVQSVEYGRRFDSLEQALAAHKIPLENYAVIRRFTDAIGISGFYGTSSYIKAVRRGVGPALNINYGWTNGFVSREEAVAAAGDVEVWTSSRGTGQWGITHPVHGSPSSGGGGAAAKDRDYGTCERCFMKFTSAGNCLCD